MGNMSSFVASSVSSRSMPFLFFFLIIIFPSLDFFVSSFPFLVKNDLLNISTIKICALDSSVILKLNYAF